MFTILAVLVAAFTLLGQIVFALGWRRKYPGRPWPLFSIVSFGSGRAFALALFLRSLPLALAAIGGYVVARFIGRLWKRSV
jgi:hypothetical protein